MTQLNSARTSSINVLGESELEQVIGGYCHRRRHHYYGSKHCGGWRPGKCHGEKSYEAPAYESAESSDSYESTDSYASSTAGGTQTVNVSVNIDISQSQV